MASWRSFLSSHARRSRTLGLALTLVLGGTALTAPGGCTLNTEGLAAGGSSGSTSTTVTTSTLTTTSTTTSTSTGTVDCVDDNDCGTSPAGSCKKKSCVSSLCVEVTDPGNTPPDDTNPCTSKACSGDGMPYQAMIQAGKPCEGMAGVCDAAGACVGCASDSDCTAGTTPSCDLVTHTCVSCSDGLQNGTETGKDCGGSCKKCNGDTCLDGTSCLSGNCADKVCCDTACNGTCQSCNLSASPGTCTSAPVEQPDPACGATNVCDAAGGCKAPTGAACGDDNTCASGICIASRCHTQTGGACTDDILCASGLCTNSVCTACSADSQCKSKACAAPTCKAPSGAVCNAGAECANGSCPSHFCVLNDGAACMTGTDCKSGYCNGGACAPCMNDGNCSGGAKCNGTFGPGTCSLPAGAYCYTSAHCPTGTTCQGKPERCQ